MQKSAVAGVPFRWTYTSLACAMILGAVFVWSYWPTLAETVQAWNRQADYSHGFLVVPLALGFLWARRGEFPRDGLRGSPWGWLLVGVASAIRVGVAVVFIESLDAWTIPVWLAGVAMLVGGWKLLRWCAPAVAFLWFMFPLPYSAEMALSLPLQRVATKLSTGTLQVLGQPAIGEGNTILLGDQVLEVEQACSGLRIFVGIFALAFAYVLFTRRTWWEKTLILVSAVPIALIANSARIVVTALLQQGVSDEAARRFTHDFSGWVMIPFAAALFALFLWYLSRLLPEFEVIDARRMTIGALQPSSESRPAGG